MTARAFVLGAWLLGCTPVESVARSANEQPRAAPELRRLDVAEHRQLGVAELKLLDVAGHDPAIVLVAAHGAWDRAEGHCELWQEIVGDRAFVLCPQGRRTDRRVPYEQAAYYYPDHFALREEVLASIAALEAEYAGRVDTTEAAFTGFSQGAIHGCRGTRGARRRRRTQLWGSDAVGARGKLRVARQRRRTLDARWTQ